MHIFKILRADEWAALQAQGETLGAPIDLADGFVHFSTAEQAAETAAKHFAGAEGLMLLALDGDAMGAALKWEPSRGGALFPHLYRALRLNEVLWAKPLPFLGEAHQFPKEMTMTSYVDPMRSQFEAFKSLDRDAPIEMLNLVLLRDKADYATDHPLANAGLSGAEAYANYGTDSGPVLTRVGGSILWRGDFQNTLIGPTDERWDHVFIARYPTAHAFLAMLSDPDYKLAVKHRQAGVDTSRLIRCAPAGSGQVFG